MSTISMNCRRAASFAGTQCLSRLRRTHGVFSRLRRSLRKQAVRSLLSAPYGKALQRQAKIFIQAKITVPPHVRNRRIKHSKALTLGIPRVRALLCFILLFLTCGGTVIFACMKIFACLCRAFPYGAESKLLTACFRRERRRREKTPCVRRRRERHCVPAKDAARLQFMEIVDISHTVFYTENDKRIKWVHGSNHTRV